MKKSTEEMLFWGAAAVGLILVLKSKGTAATNPATVPAAKPPVITDPGAGFAAGGGVAPGWGLGPMPDPTDPSWSSAPAMSGYERRRR